MEERLRATGEIRAVKRVEGRFPGVLKVRNSYLSQCLAGEQSSSEKAASKEQAEIRASFHVILCS